MQAFLFLRLLKWVEIGLPQDVAVGASRVWRRWHSPHLAEPRRSRQPGWSHPLKKIDPSRTRHTYVPVITTDCLRVTTAAASYIPLSTSLADPNCYEYAIRGYNTTTIDTKALPSLPFFPPEPSTMAKFSFFDFVRCQFLPAPPLGQVSLHGQTVIITGANVGLGLAAAKQVATLNPERLILACRSQSKGEQAVAGEYELLTERLDYILTTSLALV
jgi:hypothetical protein